MSALYTEYFLQLVNARTGNPIDDDTGVCNVLTAGSAAEATIYSDANGTAGSNPLTITNGEIHFYVASSVTSVDLTILTAKGQAIFIEDAAQAQGKVLVDTEKKEQTLIIPWKFSDNTLTDTGFDLPSGCLISEALLKVTTVDADETIDFGFDNATEGGDLDGLIAAASVASAGYVELAGQITGGSNIDYLGTEYRGALLCTHIDGADAVATVGGSTAKKYLTDGTIKSLKYTGSAGSDTGYGFFMVKYDILPV